MKLLLSPLKLNLINITLRPKYKPSLLYLVKVSNNNKKNLRSSRKITPGSSKTINTSPLRIYRSAKTKFNKFSSKFIVQEKKISKLPASFEYHFEQIGMKRKTEAENLNPRKHLKITLMRSKTII